MKMALRFLGAAGTVTGSKHLLTMGDKKILVDCGLFQGIKELRLQNRAPFLVEPSSIDVVFLTHAHLDHIGYLPLLYKNGFNGKIFCSEPTRELAKILLLDAAHIEEEDAEYANQKRYSKHDPATPLFLAADVHNVLEAFHDVEMGVWHELNAEIKYRFQTSGHIVGSSFVEIEAQGKRIVFSGDIGRSQPLTVEARVDIELADFVCVESTYGDRLHSPRSVEEEFAEVILHTLDKKGQLLIPSFAVGRTQDLLYLLYKLKKESKIPNIPVYLDSPLASEATSIFLRHGNWSSLSADELAGVARVAVEVKSRQQSKDLLATKSSSIVIAGSGMVTGGRILHHLAHRIHDPKNTILLVGYQSPGTRGSLLREGASEIKMHGEYFSVKAEVRELMGLSAHADQAEILAWLKKIKSRPKVFVVHGEPQAADVLRLKIEDELGWETMVAKQGQEVPLD